MLEKINTTPMLKPKFNISDVILIKVALQTSRDNLIPELRQRVDLIVDELTRAEIEAKRQ